MRDRKGRRRRSKVAWLRETDKRELHAIAMSLWRQMREDDWSPRQEWLFDQILVELAYWRSHSVWTERCTCWLCTPSYQDGEFSVHSPPLWEE